MNRKAVAIYALAAVFVFPSANANILSGSVSFDSITHLYTYSYALDNTSGPAAINELSVLIDTAGEAFTLEPAATTSPADWTFVKAVSGGSANPPLNEFGGFWAWQGGSLATGDTLGGFSFTTLQGPATGSNNNYFLFAPTYTGGPSPFEGIREYGHVVAPDFAPYVDPPPPIPEPATGLMLMVGAMALLGLKRHPRFQT